MSETLQDVALTSEWTEITATVAALASVDVYLQNVGNEPVAVVFGGASAPVNRSGTVLSAGAAVQGNNANIWARSLGSGGTLSTATI